MAHPVLWRRSGRRSPTARRMRRHGTETVGPIRRRTGKGEPTAMAGVRGCAVSWPVQTARRDGDSKTANAARSGHRCGATTGSRLRRRSGLRTPPGMGPRDRRSVRRPWSGTSPHWAASARCRAPGPGTSRRPCGGRCGSGTRVVAAISTGTAGGAAAPLPAGDRSHRVVHARRRYRAVQSEAMLPCARHRAERDRSSLPRVEQADLACSDLLTDLRVRTRNGKTGQNG